MTSSAKNSFIAAFADELRRAREYNGIALAEVAAVTKVLSEYLEALESGRWEVIPPPYLRGCLSQYAQAVGMNVDKVLQGFDQLMSGIGEEQPATLDSSDSLLPQPEYIGLSRAKIRTAWFADLMRNRKMAYVALMVSIGVCGVGLSLFRQAHRAHRAPSPFRLTQMEYERVTRGPVTYIRTFSSDSIAHNVNRKTGEIHVIAADTGTVTFVAGYGRKKTIAFRPFDTLLIDYDTLTCVSLYPSQSAVVLLSGKDTLSPQRLAGDTASYLLFIGKAASQRPVSAETDK